MKNLIKKSLILAAAALMLSSAVTVLPAAKLSVHAEIETGGDEEETVEETGSAPAPATLDGGRAVSDKTTLIFPKDLVVTDVDNADFKPAVPGVTFNYTIVPANLGETGSMTLEHPQAGNITIKNGIAGATITGPSFGSGDTLVDGQNYARKNVTVDFSGVTFTEPGVYRYVITETGYETNDTYNYTTDDIANIDDNNNKRYLDVYVDRKENGTLGITGYILYKNRGASTGNETTDSSLSEKDKSNGYTTDTNVVNGGGSVPGGTPGVGVSTFKTYDVTVKKVVTGAILDSNKNFAFTLGLPARTGAKYKYHKGTEADTDLTTNSLSINLKHNEMVTLKGVPMSATVSVKEDNYTSEYHAPTAAVDEAAAAAMAVDGDKYKVDATSNGTDNDSTDVVVTNNRKTVPPTGIAMMVAPYAAMILLAGMLALLFVKRRNNR